MCILHNNLLLVSLNIAGWSARKLDKKVSAEVAEQHHAEAGIGSYRKSLIARSALAEWVKVTGEARTLHYRLTSPWADGGFSVLTTALYFDYMQKMGELKVRAMAAAQKLFDSYPQLVADAKAQLGTMYRESDYPPQAVVEAKFRFSWSIAPLPASGHIVTDLVSEEEDRLKSDLDQRVSDALDSATRDCWDRLYQSVEAIRSKMNEEGKGKKGRVIFRDSLIGNLQDLVGLLPKLNPTGDEALNRMAEEARLKLAGLNPGDLRDYPAERTKAAAEADEILKKMSAFM